MVFSDFYRFFLRHAKRTNECLIENRCDNQAHDGADNDADETWHHEGVVEQVLTNLRCA